MTYPNFPPPDGPPAATPSPRPSAPNSRRRRIVAITAVSIVVLAIAGNLNDNGDDSTVVAPSDTQRPTVTPPTEPPSTAERAEPVATAAAPTQVPATSTASPATAPPTEAPTTTMRPTTTASTAAPTTTSAPPTTAPAEDTSLLALDVLANIPVLLEQQSGYDRSLFSEGLDQDGDGCNTRAEVLLRDSTVDAASFDGCSQIAGRWLSRYDGIVTGSPQDLEVDHVVSLKEAWDSGAWSWSDQHRTNFTNDLGDRRALRAVTVASNRAKGDRDPSNWIPSDPEAVCRYIGDWVAVKARWKLAMDQSEWGRIKNLLNDRCDGQRIGEWRNTHVQVPQAPPPPTTIPPPTTAPPPPPPPPPTTAPPPPPPTTAAPPPPPPPTTTTVAVLPVLPQPPTDVYYQNCDAARAAGAAPVYRGDPGYASHLDRDNDGVGCES